MYIKNTRDSKTSGLQQGNDTSQNVWNLNSNVLQGAHVKSKSK